MRVMVKIPSNALLPMLMAMALIPIGDTAGKLLTDSHDASPFFVAWSRFAIGAILVAPLALRHLNRTLLSDWRIWLRAMILVAGITSILTALRTEPIADVFGAFFIGPILSWALSVWLLREPFSILRLLLMCVGFVGVILVVKPGFGMTPGMGFAVLAGLFYGLYLVMNRAMAAVASPRALLMSQLLIGALVLAIPGLLSLPAITITVSGLTVISAAGSAVGNFLLIAAYTKAEASRMAPFVYTQLLWATMLGQLIFGATPDALALVGLMLLVASGAASILVRR